MAPGVVGATLGFGRLFGAGDDSESLNSEDRFEALRLVGPRLVPLPETAAELLRQQREPRPLPAGVCGRDGERDRADVRRRV